MFYGTSLVSSGWSLERKGWLRVDELLKACSKNGIPFGRCELFEIVEADEKQRFTISEDRAKIRAAQGHSIDIDLGLTPKTPPARLLHGTATKSLDAIFNRGLLPCRRQHVHLQTTHSEALAVGARHGNPIVLRVDAKKVADGGTLFFLSENGVWLCDHVPPSAIEISSYGGESEVV